MKEKCIIIAEAGVNHNGDLETAKKLIEKAANSGADYIKFQTFKAEKLVTREAKKAFYQIKNNDENTQFNMLKKLELKECFYKELLNHCKSFNIGFASTGFHEDDISFLDKFNLDFIKIASGEITNFPLIKKACQKARKLIISTGMCNLEEVKNTINFIECNGFNKSEISLLHCTTEYPAPFESVNLRAINTLKKPDINVGYSDHTLGTEVAIAAVALGAKIIEKHITLNKDMEGPDHRSSLEPNEFKRMVAQIKNIEFAMGSGIKKPSKQEKENLKVIRKSLVAKKRINIGEEFTTDNITCKRPANGLCPTMFESLIGLKAHKDFFEDDFLELPPLT